MTLTTIRGIMYNVSNQDLLPNSWLMFIFVYVTLGLDATGLVRQSTIIWSDVKHKQAPLSSGILVNPFVPVAHKTAWYVWEYLSNQRSFQKLFEEEILIRSKPATLHQIFLQSTNTAKDIFKILYVQTTFVNEISRH